MNRTDRMLAIVLELQAKRWRRAEDLAEAFEVSTRTIYRDMQALAEGGFPLVAVPGKGYKLYEGYFLPPLMFTTDEAAMLLLGSRYMARHFDEHYQQAARAGAMKVEAALPEHLRTEVERLQEGIRFVPVNAFDDPEVQSRLRLLRKALVTGRRVRFRDQNRPGDAPGEAHLVDPYGLVHTSGAWMLVGYCHRRASVRTFRLSRMRELALLEDRFERPAGYKLQRGEAHEDHDQTVRVVFDAEVARWVQETPSFYMTGTEPQPDGRLLVTLRVRRETEVMPWLLSWGAHVQILEPAALRERLAREAQRMAERHRGPALLV